MAGNGSRYSNELREEALKLSDEIGNKAAADKLGINIKTLAYWRTVRKRQEEKKLNCVQRTHDLGEEIKDNPYVTFQPSEKQEEKEYHRGEIYYVAKYATTGCEIATGRPAIIISNDRINNSLNTVEVVFLTSQVKPLTPEHILTRSSGRMSTVIGEQISTVDKNRIREFIGECTPDEMQKIELGLLHSLGLEKYADKRMSDEQVILRLSEMKAEKDALKAMYDRLFDRVMMKK